MPDLDQPVILLEKAIAAHLSRIKNVRVDRFADSFKSQGKVTQSRQLRVGHQASDFNTIDDGQKTGQVIEREVARYEIGCEVVSLNRHDEALQLIGEACRILTGFQPYTNITPIARVRYGDARFDPGRGIWEYVGVVTAAIVWKNGTSPIIQLIDELDRKSVV